VPTTRSTTFATPCLDGFRERGRRGGGRSGGSERLPAEDRDHRRDRRRSPQSARGRCRVHSRSSGHGSFRLQADGRDGARRALLTGRENEILRLVAQGHSYGEIGEQLFISPKTVRNHVQNILRKLQLGKRYELVRYAIEHGLDRSPVTRDPSRCEGASGGFPDAPARMRDARPFRSRCPEAP